MRAETKVVYVIGRIDPLGTNSEAARRRRSISSWVKMWHDRGRLGSPPNTAVGGHFVTLVFSVERACKPINGAQSIMALPD
jgi:hypothetical protein